MEIANVLGDYVAYISTLLAIIASLIGIIQWRKSEFRHSEVVDWSNQCIEVSQTLFLLMQRDLKYQDVDNLDLFKLSVSASVLVEKGRLLFRNVKGRGDLERYGEEKSPAYRGLRPMILDHMILVHEAAMEWEHSSSEKRAALAIAVCSAERSFVSMAQCEVGRARTASSETSKAGDGSPLRRALGKSDRQPPIHLRMKEPRKTK